MQNSYWISIAALALSSCSQSAQRTYTPYEPEPTRSSSTGQGQSVEFEHLLDAESLAPARANKWNTFRGITLGTQITNFDDLRWEGHRFCTVEQPDALGGLEIESISYYAKMGVLTRLVIHFSDYEPASVEAILTNRFGLPHQANNDIDVDVLRWLVDEDGNHQGDEPQARYQISLFVVHRTRSYGSEYGVWICWDDLVVTAAEFQKEREIYSENRDREINDAVQDSLDDF